MENIYGNPVYVISDKPGFNAVRFVVQQTGEKILTIGSELPQDRNLQYILYGEWIQSKKYGTEFKVLYYEDVLPDMPGEIVAYIANLKCGVGKKTAQKLVAKFGRETLSVVMDTPERLKEAELSPAKVKKLVKAICVRRMGQMIRKEFGGESIDNATVAAILTTFGEDSLKVLKEEPYTVTYIKGVGFKTIDSFALKNGFEKTSKDRLCAAVPFAMQMIEMSGSSCADPEDVIAAMEKIVGYDVPVDVIKKGINCCVAAKEIIFDTENRMIYSPKSYADECGIAENLRMRLHAANAKVGDKVKDLIREYEKESGIEMSEKQKDAVLAAFENSVSIITGGPGTGKTTTIKAILFAAEKLDKKTEIRLLAPTGKAAHRMAEVTRHPASTIHSALRYYEKDGKPCVADGIDGDLVVVDEMSMISQDIAAMLLENIVPEARIVFCGDVDQLPSVGAGNILKDMIASGKIPVTVLDKIYRQADGSAIIDAAALINAGDFDGLTFSKNFQFIERVGAEAVLDTAVELYCRAIQKYGMDEVMMLIPTRKKGTLCVNAINKVLQDRLNPTGPAISRNGMNFRAGDRVMQTKNTEFASNGDVGAVSSVKLDEDELEVRYADETVNYSDQDIMLLDLAYCTTVHKSQGSEYKCVILLQDEEHRPMLQRNLVYTGVTRAKECCVVIGQKKSMNYAVKNIGNSTRKTGLAKKIKKKSEEKP